MSDAKPTYWPAEMLPYVWDWLIHAHFNVAARALRKECGYDCAKEWKLKLKEQPKPLLAMFLQCLADQPHRVPLTSKRIDLAAEIPLIRQQLAEREAAALAAMEAAGPDQQGGKDRKDRLRSNDGKRKGRAADDSGSSGAVKKEQEQEREQAEEDAGQRQDSSRPAKRAKTDKKSDAAVKVEPAADASEPGVNGAANGHAAEGKPGKQRRKDRAARNYAKRQGGQEAATEVAEQPSELRAPKGTGAGTETERATRKGAAAEKERARQDSPTVPTAVEQSAEEPADDGKAGARKKAKKAKQAKEAAELAVEAVPAEAAEKKPRKAKQAAQSGVAVDGADRSEPAAAASSSPPSPSSASSGAAGSRKASNKPFQRVDPSAVSPLPLAMQDNSYSVERAGAYGAVANAHLSVVKGKGFRHEKTKKKRGNYRGGELDQEVRSIKFTE